MVERPRIRDAAATNASDAPLPRGEQPAVFSSGLTPAGRGREGVPGTLLDAGPALRFDDLLDATQEVHLLKLDLDGFEFFALQGATRLLETQQVRTILLESSASGFSRFSLVSLVGLV